MTQKRVCESVSVCECDWECDWECESDSEIE